MTMFGALVWIASSEDAGLSFQAVIIPVAIKHAAAFAEICGRFNETGPRARPMDGTSVHPAIVATLNFSSIYSISKMFYNDNSIE